MQALETGTGIKDIQCTDSYSFSLPVSLPLSLSLSFVPIWLHSNNRLSSYGRLDAVRRYGNQIFQPRNPIGKETSVICKPTPGKHADGPYLSYMPIGFTHCYQGDGQSYWLYLDRMFLQGMGR